MQKTRRLRAVGSSGLFGDVSRPPSDKPNDLATICEIRIELNSDRAIEYPRDVLSPCILVSVRRLGS